MRGYIVGAGHTLDMKFLDSIANEFTFSTNSIGAIYSKTVWRPTVYVLASNNFKHADWRPDYLKSMAEAGIVFAREDYVKKYNLRGTFPYEIREEGFSYEPNKWMSKFGTCLLTCVQLAVHMEFEHLVFVGCPGFSKDPTERRQHVDGYPDWAEDITPNYSANILYKAHELIASHTNKRGIKVTFEGESQFAHLYGKEAPDTLAVPST